MRVLLSETRGSLTSLSCKVIIVPAHGGSAQMREHSMRRCGPSLPQDCNGRTGHQAILVHQQLLLVPAPALHLPELLVCTLAAAWQGRVDRLFAASDVLETVQWRSACP
jgi:hypothetical protein